MTTRRPDYRKEPQTVWSCLPFIRSGQNHLARHSERGKKTRLTEEEVGRQHQGMDRRGVRQVPEGSGEQGKMEKTGCKIICGAPTTLAVKGLMMMMMMMMMMTMTQHSKKQQQQKNNHQKSRFNNSQWTGSTARYYTSHTKTMLPTRKSVPRSSR